MKKTVVFLYGVVGYLAFFLTFLYLIGFVGNVIVAKSVDLGYPASGGSVLLNFLLVALFGIQHSVMARPTFKRWWTKLVPHAIERSTYVFAACVTLILLYWLWEPMPSMIWNFEGGFLGSLMWVFFWIGWGLVLISSFLINHFDLFGLRQVFLYAQGKPYTPVQFKVAGVYKLVRNPLMLGFLIAFWFTPVMTSGHLLFSVAMTLYIFIGIYFEERNIAEHLGDSYREYRRQTSMIFPFKLKK
ncbi:MAG: isoprenylcysteine carboxylmethyltransferase family protein [Candidatus Omnitrophica bacterium]|nr:isoprenylcysteine carboxylmethyltransferase family protein [Candidatus Omnitrophota bacterium]